MLAATQTTFLRNVLMRVPEYRQSLKAIKARARRRSSAVHSFSAMESPVFKPAPADTVTDLQSSTVANLGSGHWNWIGAIPLGSAGTPAVAVANGREVHSVERRDVSLPRWRVQRAPHPKESCRSTSTTISKPTWCSPAPAEFDCCAQDSPNAFTRCDRADQTAEVRDQCALHRGMGRRHRSRRRSRYRARRQQGRSDSSEK